jgi:hypothetical protein
MSPTIKYQVAALIYTPRRSYIDPFKISSRIPPTSGYQNGLVTLPTMKHTCTFEGSGAPPMHSRIRKKL